MCSRVCPERRESDYIEELTDFTYYLTEFSKALLVGILSLLISCEGSLRKCFMLLCYTPQHIIKRSGQIRHLARVLIFYCYVTNDHTFNALKQCMYIISQFPWVRSLSILQLGPLQGCNQNVSQHWLLMQMLHWEGSAPGITQVVGRFQPKLWQLGSSKTVIDSQQDRVLCNEDNHRSDIPIPLQQFFISKLQVQGIRLYKEVIPARLPTMGIIRAFPPQEMTVKT